MEVLAPVSARVFVTPLPSERTATADELASLVAGAGVPAEIHADVFAAMSAARRWAGEDPRRAVVVAGSVVLAGEAISVANEEGWMP